MLELKDISKSFGGVMALSSTSFTLQEKEIFGLIGPNGAGKTTLINIISRNYKQDSGEIFFQGREISALKPHEILRFGMARTFQNIRLFSSMTVLENVLIALHERISYSFIEAFLHLGRFRKEEVRAKNEAIELLQRLDLLKYANSLATELSYGLQRKVEIVRALAASPKLLLLDEPVAGMNASESAALADLILELKNDLSILLIEHDMSFVNKLCDRVLVLDYGRVIFTGKPSEAVKSEEVISAYLGSVDA